MKMLGLIGGISWVSTVDYYRLINQGINDRLGGLNFSRCIIHSFNYADIKRNNDTNDWERTFAMLLEAGLHLKAGGAAAIVLCANTMHHIADRLEAATGLPLIHIASAAAAAVEAKGLKKVGLLGTRFTMELDFFSAKLAARGIETIIPANIADRGFIHTTIFEELGRGLTLPETKQRYLAIMDELVTAGAEGIILGCTEIPLLVQQADVAVPVFDTTAIHCAAAVDFSVEG